MNSKDYWAKRSALDMARYMRTAEQTAALMEQTGKAAADYINSLIKGVFTGFEGFGISEKEARNILAAGNDRTALQRLRAAASRVTDPEKRQALTNAINSAGAYRFRIDRLEEVSRQITTQCNSLYKTQLSAVRSCLGGIASESYYRAVFNIQQRTGLGFSFAMFPKSQVEQLLSKHWCGASYSQRLWRDTDILADRLKDELLIGLLSGRSGEKTARVIREQFGNNAYCARRLVRTESAYVCNAAALSGYGEAGIERYIFIATLDQKTSEVCAELDGQSFPRSEAKAGTNLPPMHPFCRSTTIADFGEDTLKNLERRAKDKDGNTVTVPADMKYSEWREKFVDGNSGGNRTQGLTNGAGDGIIKAGSERMTISSIDSPIEQRHTGKGSPNAILHFDVELNNRQQELLDALPDYDSRVSVLKTSVNMADLSALTAKTGDEFAMFTKGGERLIIRGKPNMVNIGPAAAKKLAEQGYRWSGHTHPGADYNVLMPSTGDKDVLKQFPQETSVIYNSSGKYYIFGKE